MRFSPMLVLRRALLYAAELAVLGLGVAGSLVIALWIATARGCDSSRDCSYAVPLLIVYSGWLLTVIAFFVLRSRTRQWKIEYSACLWRVIKARRRMHPVRARYVRIAKRIIIWLPSAVAAMVLFFFPVITHLIYPGSGDLPGCHVPIPWSATVYRLPYLEHEVIVVFNRGWGWCGLTPFCLPEIVLRSDAGISIATFSVQPRSSRLDLSAYLRRYEPDSRVLKEFQIRHSKVTCWNRHPKMIEWYFSRFVTCDAPAFTSEGEFDATFRGKEADLPVFLGIVENTRLLR